MPLEIGYTKKADDELLEDSDFISDLRCFRFNETEAQLEDILVEYGFLEFKETQLALELGFEDKEQKIA